jgi:hypothetical protein
MKRFLIFVLLGPLLGYVTFLIRNIYAGKIVDGEMGALVGLPFAYLFALPVVLVMWIEDHFLSSKIGLRWKVVTSACVGYAAAIAMLLITSALQLPLPEILSFGITGAVSAAVCSWLSGVQPRLRRMQRDETKKA